MNRPGIAALPRKRPSARSAIRAANRGYRRVLLTASEARLLAGGQWESRAFCSRPWLRWLPLAPLGMALLGWLAGAPLLARIGVAAAIGLAALFAAPRLPVYTPARARLFRAVKWLCLAAGFLAAAGPSLANAPWMFAVCAWPLAWIEIERAAIRRKLPVSAWPKQLYL